MIFDTAVVCLVAKERWPHARTSRRFWYFHQDLSLIFYNLIPACPTGCFPPNRIFFTQPVSGYPTPIRTETQTLSNDLSRIQIKAPGQSQSTKHTDFICSEDKILNATTLFTVLMLLDRKKFHCVCS